ncbi:amino acid adenylation domain-containing protein [Burkholderia sp. 22PA0106]|uniref:non-ribosomal peptide synthetase n=1 Tax=Burkholderia sp. 22PA0106 TaxID=3237371 RepID=UPI0039C202CD
MEDLSLDALKEELLALLAAEAPGLPTADDEAPVPVARDAAMPLSFAQQRMWFLDRLDSRAGAAYHVPAGVRLSGALDVAALRRALDRIVERHEALRTCFEVVGGEPVQRIDAPAPFALATHDLSPSGTADVNADIDAQAQRHLRAEASTAFDLATGPLVRGRLLKLGEREHVLLVTMHHIVSDGWSMGVLIREFSALYQAFSAGRADPLGPLPIQYADYVAWQRRRLGGEAWQAQLAYWARSLHDAPALSTLPADRARPAVQDYAASSVEVAFDAALSGRVRAFAQRHGTTVFNVVLAAWAALLGRLSGQDEVVIGMPVANRTCTEVEPLIGLFVNTLALRIDLSGQPRAHALVARVHAATLAAQGHQDIPFDQVIEAVNPPRSRAHAPLFQTMLAWQTSAQDALALGTLELHGMVADRGEEGRDLTQLDLSLELGEYDGGIAGHAMFATSLFERASIERYLGYFEALLGAMVDEASAPVQLIGLLAEAERRQVMDGGNDTAMAYMPSLGVHGAFEAQVARTPDAVAVRFGDQALTYAQLDARANRLAHRLVELGVGREVVVGVCLHRGVDLLAALLAVMKAGGAYLPLDPAFPAKRLAMMLEDAQPALVLTRDGLLADHDKRLDLGEWPVGPEQFDSVRLDGSGGELAYVLYTSGSTGRPKGVQVTQQNVLNLLASMQRDLPLQAHDRLLSVTTLSFDIAALELYLPLLCGACVVIAARETALEPSRLAREIETQQITAMQATPSTWRMLVDHGWQPKPGFMVLSGGEALPCDLAESLLRAVPSLVNLYGPTETTIWSTLSRLAHSEEGTRIDIGRPIANTQVHVLDDALELVPVGVAGELFIAGDGVARGYRSRPDLTAERFVPNPYGAPGSRMYRTGDRVRRLATGELAYLGRIDQQVKLRGFRIELGEIEATLRGQPEVRDAAVTIREDQPGQKRLVAYVVAAHGQEPANVQALRQALSRRLPEYMIPSQLVWLDALPLTPNGKLDRRALPTPDAPQSGTDYVAPRTETEQTLSTIWSDILKIDRVGLHDNFFDLGGHSLLAVQLASSIRSRLGVEVPLPELFAHPTLGQFAQAVEHANASALPPIMARGANQAAPLSFAQQRLWFLDRLDKRAGAAYHIPVGVRLNGALDADALRQALDRILARHDVLRTRFVLANGEPEQRVDAAARFALTAHDLSALAQPEAEVQRHAETEAAEPFDLSAGPLVRGRLLRLSEHAHVLLVTMHHTVSDGWSMGVLIREFGALYRAFSEGRGDPLPPLAIQYGDYAAWQRHWLAGEVLQRQLAYWKTTLHGASELTTLPLDRARPAVQDYTGDSIDVTLDAPLSAKLKTLARRQGTTVFNVVLAAWAALAGRLSGQDDVVIGTPAANRMRSEVEPLIGFFVNTLALRIDLSGRPSVSELLKRVHDTTLAAQSHQDLPFDQVIEAINPSRSLAHAPLFQTMLVWQNNARADLDLGDITLQAMAAAQAPSQFDVTLELGESDTGIAGRLMFASSVFERASVERYLGYFTALLDGMAADADQPMLQLRMLPEAERRQVMHGWNDTAMACERAQSVHGMFEAQVARTPDAVAVRFEDEALTYAQLNARANRLADHLVTRGVGPDVMVGICMHRGIDLLAALLGVMKAGGGYLPLDPAFPAERLAMMLDDAHPAFVLTNEGLLADHAKRLDLSEWPAGNSDFRRDERPDGDQIAYILYTSGSTGRPKGVQVTQHGMLNILLSLQRDLKLEAQDKLLSVSTLSFDIAALELCLPLFSGACVVIASRETALDPSKLSQALESREITAMQATPSTWRMLMDFGWKPVKDFLLISTGEALPRDLAEQLLQSVASVVNLYGPTETTMYSTISRVFPSEHGVRIDIGRPVANTQAHILDEALELVPIGVAGELFLAGAGVSRGYRDRPDLTAERFIPNPYGEPGSRMYRTGDLVRWLPHGELEYLGRIDQQVKLRGFRIELGEIEATLRGLPEIRDAAAMVREDQPGHKRLVGYVVAAEGHAPAGTQALRQALSLTLPDYMVPSQLMWLDALPQTPNGKLDRRSLPKPEALQGEADYLAPRTETEQALSAIWRDVLKLDRVGVHDNFFELGGHSLLAVQVGSAVRTRLGVEVPLAALFAQPTLSRFAQVVEHAAATDLPPIALRDSREAARLSFAQQRLWFLDQLDKRAGAAYHIPVGVRLSGALNADALHGALNRIVERHEALRTRFVVVDGVPVQHIDAPAPFALTLHDLSGAADPDHEVAAHTRDEAAAPFDLSAGPLVRGRLLRLDEREHVLLVTMHHIVSDGWSMSVLIREFGALYRAFGEGRGDPLAQLSIQYADYAAWQRRWLAGEVLQRQLAYWQATLQGAPELSELPLDRARPAVKDYAGETVEVVLDAPLSAGIKALARQQGTTPFNVVLAAWAALAGRLSGQDDVVIGTPVANRMRSEVEPLIGFFVNTLALRIDLSGRPAVGELVTRVHAATLAAQAHQDLPFDQVIEAINPARSTSHAPLFQLMLVWQNTEPADLDLGEVRLQGLSADRDRAQFDVTLALGEHEAGFAGRVTFDTALFERASIERYLGYFKALLAGMTAGAAEPMHALEILPPAERQRIVHAWNDTAVPRDPAQTAHGMFEAQVARTPDAVAVLFEDEALSYAELNARANRLARHLVAQGVGADRLVALCLHRGVETLVAVLAVLKAGGAYVPLDPQLPDERLARMLRDCAPAAVLADHASVARLPPGAVALDGPQAVDTSGQPAHDLALRTYPAQLAYCIYTSGSTGQPKCVQLTHEGLTNLTHIMWKLYHLKVGDRVLQFSAPGFDVSVSDYFKTITQGATLCMAPREQLMPRVTLEATVARMGVQVATLPPAVLAAMDGDALPGVHTLVTAGDACTQALVARWSNGRRFLNAYGPAEVTASSSNREVSAAFERLPPIGKPHPNLQFYVLDAEGRLLPAGIPGELFIAGVGVGRGYGGRPDLTAERFLPNPFGAPGSRMYRTGDRVRWLPQGELEYLERIDNQVKLRGFRIELGEIEASLVALPEVREAAVVVREDQPGNKRLVGYLVAAEGGEAAGVQTGVQTIRAALARTLPDYMVPSQLVWLDALPLTPNGKLDRRALPAPGAIVSEADYVAPRTETERRIGEIWAEVLGVARVGIHDNFFELGGHSLQMVHVHQQLTLLSPKPVSMIDLFQYPTIAQLVGLLHAQADEEKAQIQTQVDAAARRGEQRRRRHASTPAKPR